MYIVIVTLLMFPIMANKEKKPSTSNWCNIHYDVFDLVLSRLSFFDKLRVQGVCTSWCSFSKTHISVISNKSQFPLLMLPTNYIKKGFIGFDSSYNVSDKTTSYFEDSDGCCLYKIDDKKIRKFISIPKEIEKSYCVGSSQGWLVFLDEKDNRWFHIFNPFFDICISLSSLPKLPYVVKAILWSDPILSGSKYALVAIGETEPNNIYYAVLGGKHSNWRCLEGNNSPYLDIISFKDFVYTLGESCSIEAWDFSTYEPTKKISIKPTLLQDIIKEFQGILKFFYSLIWYLVPSQDRLFLVMRSIEAFVEVYEDGVTQYLPSPYETKKFYVFELNEKEEKWLKTESLGDMLLILGRNISVSVAAKDFKGYEKNTIYFTDHSRYLIPGGHNSGHDLGMFSLVDGSIKLFFGHKRCRLNSKPFWVVPHLLEK